jgi:hypothetical protein
VLWLSKGLSEFILFAHTLGHFGSSDGRIGLTWIFAPTLNNGTTHKNLVRASNMAEVLDFRRVRRVYGKN